MEKIKVNSVATPFHIPESPEIDKEEDELLNFLKWFNDGRWYKDMETNWRRNFAYKEPEILTSEELVKLYRTPVNLKP